MATPFEISSRYVDDVIALSPDVATALGAEGSDHLWTDRSPEGHVRRNDLNLGLIAAMRPHLDNPHREQRLAAGVLSEYGQLQVNSFDGADHLRDLAHTASAFQTYREIFEVMDSTDPKAAENIVVRLESMGGALQQYQRSLSLGLAEGRAVATRQAESVLDQARSLIGPSSAWHMAEEGSPIPERTRDAVVSAKVAMSTFAEFVERDYLPRTADEDGVGPEKYLRGAEAVLGMEIDAAEVYDWGWEEIDRLLRQMDRVAGEIDDSLSVSEVVGRLETDPSLAVHSREDFLNFVSERQRQAIVDLDGVHFDLSDEIRQVTVNFAPPGGALGAYYRDPSEDFSRPGGIYYSVGDQTSFPLYQEVSTAYHEGFPGHHLQIGTSLGSSGLSRTQRALIWYPGYGEGWALYTERLMDELGYFERPEWVFGMLASQLFRASRVVADIGLHLGFQIPDGAPLNAGERWNFENACVFMRDIGLQQHDYAVSDVLRYLGWPAQAISYKVGEREILKIRDSERSRLGAGFDLKDFHSRVLGDGEMGLTMLARVVDGSFFR